MTSDQAVGWGGKRLVALEPAVEMRVLTPDVGWVEVSGDASEGVRAGLAPSCEKPVPEPLATGLLERVQAPEAGEQHDEK